MPWCGPNGDRPYPSLGWDLWALLDELWPDEPLIDEQARKLVQWYRLDPDSGRRVWRRGQLMGPKGVGKSPEGARVSFLELSGPVTFDGWDSEGEPVGRPWDKPLVQIAAVSEEQGENTYGALLELLTHDDGRVADQFGLDAGQTRILRRGQPAARIDAVTASAGTRQGQRVTFGLLDETHLWLPPQGPKLAQTIRDNVTKMGGTTLETTNAYDPNLQTVAQATDQAVEKNAEGIYQWKPQAPRVASLANRADLRSALRKVYGGAHWVDVERVIEDIHDPDMTEDNARRYFLNEVIKTADAAWSPDLWKLRRAEVEPSGDGDAIAVGFDGAKFHDSTALWACRMADAHFFRLGLWEKPDSAGEDWEVNSHDVEVAVAGAFDRFRVVRFYGDPPYWQDELARWAATHGQAVSEWWTNRDKPMAWAVRRFTEGMSGQFTHDGDPDLARHVGNARKRPTNIRDGEGRFMWSIRKDFAQSPRKIDAAVTAVLALEARADALTAGWKPKSGAKVYAF